MRGAALALVLLVSSHKKPTVMSVPPACIDVDKFLAPCPKSKGIGWECRVHVIVKPDPACNVYNTDYVISVPK